MKSDALIAAAPGFDEPLELLLACHDRITARCETLARLVDYLPAHGVDASLCEAAKSIVRYFDTSALHHHQDEELDLFPALRGAARGAAAEWIAFLTAALTCEHDELRIAWQSLRGPLAAIASGQPAPFNDVAVFAFIALYSRHVERENSELLPLAARILSPAARRDLGRRMAERRLVRPA